MSMFTAAEVNSNLMYDSVPSKMRGKTISALKMYPNLKATLGDSRVHDANFAFLTSTLSKLYKNLIEPKYYTTYKNDIDIDIGGGFVDYITSYSVSWSGIANEMRNVVGNGANYIPRVNAGMTQTNYNVYTFELAYDLRFIELEKAKKLELQKSIESIYNNVITAGWDFFCQKIAYTGGDSNHYGLFNHTDKVPVNVTNISKANIADVSDTDLAGVINGILLNAYVNSGMNVNVIPDRFLVPTWFASALVGRFSNLYANSLFDYIKEHNFATATSGGKIKIEIVPRPGLDTLGAAETGRIVAYKKDKDFVRMDMPYPIKHYITLPNIERMAYTTAFVGQVSEVQLPYSNGSADKSSPVQYWDFVA